MDKSKENPTLKQAHLQAATSPRSNQSLQKSLLCQRQEKNKKISHASQKLNLPTHIPTVNTMIIRYLKTKDKEPQLTTTCIKHLGLIGYAKFLSRIKVCYRLIVT